MSCSGWSTYDGPCGATDCASCHPNTFWMTEEDEEAYEKELKETEEWKKELEEIGREAAEWREELKEIEKRQKSERKT